MNFNVRGGRRHENGANGANGARPEDARSSGSEASPERRIEWAGADEIFTPLPPVVLTVPALKIAAGAPTAIAGSSFSGKTNLAQHLALIKALGARLFGIFDVEQGNVGHVDGEQGRRITYERYQRMLRAIGAEPGDLAGKLMATIFPEVRLDSRDAVDVYARAVDGLSMCIMDSLKALTPTLDENTGEVRRALDLVGAISEKTGTAFVFIDHLRKSGSGDPDAPAGERLRGHSSKKDALQSLILISGVTGGPKRVEQDKERLYGLPFEPFGFLIEDVAKDGDPRWGLKLVHLDREQLNARPDAQGGAQHAKTMHRIEAFLVANNPFPGSPSSLVSRMKMNRNAFYAALAELVGRGHVVVQKRPPLITWLGATGRATSNAVVEETAAK